MPLSPSIIMSLASSAVAAIRLTKGYFLACSLTHSAPVRVLPQPRPASISHVRHSHCGANCSGLPQSSQSFNKVRAASWLNDSILAALCWVGIAMIELFKELLSGINYIHLSFNIGIDCGFYFLNRLMP